MKQMNIENLYVESVLTKDDLEEAKFLAIAEQLPLKQAKDYVLRQKENERLRKLNNAILW